MNKFLWTLEEVTDAKDQLSKLTDIELQTQDDDLLQFCELLRYNIARNWRESESVESGWIKVRSKKKADELPNKQDSK